MIKEDQTPSHITKQNMIMMKGQSVPLLGYHVLRDHILQSINGEYQNSILYWAGRNLAKQLAMDSFEDCMNLFLELGWGLLQLSHSTQNCRTFQLHSPHFQARNIDDNQTTFSLECGFLAETLAMIENKDTEGNYRLVSKAQELYVELQVFLQEREGIK